ncbi:hypothetical protein [Ancylobacter pratisalsi]|uniref:DUF3108 domain-containing protein n=1 Tax=Ancylobacter pratisalsi TaxID=1745854 RepID=A0A6P1YRL7_9HYPH|nr:hypothetical protein [Ancylobacter pratisalsi]QIB35346.1 hypothetical protein G3A50_17745 [Ancylobacter pratisalsi]
MLRVPARFTAGFSAGVLALALAAMPAVAAPSAKALFFDAPYLSSVAPGTTLNYTYKHMASEERLGQSFDETMAMDVEAAPEDAAGRVVDVAITRGTQESEAGPFPTMNGNPIALVLLEREVREMAQLTKGSPFYLRNRLREHLASGKVEPASFEYDGKKVEGWRMTMVPFADDPNKDKLAELAGRHYEFLFSDAVPGGLYSINVVTPKADGAGNIIETSLTLTGTTVSAAKQAGGKAP